MNAFTSTDIPLLKRCRKLGEGAYGSVIQYKHQKTQEDFAVKEVPIKEDEDDGIPVSFIRESLVLATFSHPHLLSMRYANVNSTENTVSVILPLFEMDLTRLMRSENSQKFNPIHIQCLMKQILKGAAELHSNGILHRDLKPHNILARRNKQFVSGWQLQIADFGLSRIAAGRISAEGVASSTGLFGDDSDSSSSFSLASRAPEYSSEVCTLWYRAPEIILGGQYGFSSDIWSLGCIFAELLKQGEHFLPGASEIDQLFRIFEKFGTPSETYWPEALQLPHFQSHIFPKWPMPTSPNQRKKRKKAFAAYCLLGHLLQLDPKKRWTAEQALNHFYFL